MAAMTNGMSMGMSGVQDDVAAIGVEAIREVTSDASTWMRDDIENLAT